MGQVCYVTERAGGAGGDGGGGGRRGRGGLRGVHCPLIPDVGKKGNEVCGGVKWRWWALQRRVIISFKEAQWRAFFVGLQPRVTAGAGLTLSRETTTKKTTNQ